MQLDEQTIEELKCYPLQYRIKRLRCITELSQEEFANKLGYTQATVSNWESGRKAPNGIALEKLRKFFNLPYNFFIDVEIERLKRL